MALESTAWTRDLLTRRRALHSAIDGLARSRPAEAARARLEVYTVTHRFSIGEVTAAEVDESFAVLEATLIEVSQAA
ncbi:hypothetical protein ACEXQD_08510 [Herbiconiux sp. P15]|uniref:hypothetical protein n=1 Tax=Herbiconiux liukaitaii TaxID=3342799 RepID=UPI0035B77CD5